MSLARLHSAITLTAAALASALASTAPVQMAAQAPMQMAVLGASGLGASGLGASGLGASGLGASGGQVPQTGVQASRPTQQPGPAPGTGLTLIPMKQMTFTPQIAHLIELEAKFSDATLTGGGKAFASFFADDGVVLGNALAPIVGKAAIKASAQWEPGDYQLSWLPNAVQVSAADDMGYTWGRYTAVSRDSAGKLTTTTGRYMTIWRLMPDKSWKVVLESSAQEPPSAAALRAPPTGAPAAAPVASAAPDDPALRQAKDGVPMASRAVPAFQ